MPTISVQFAITLGDDAARTIAELLGSALRRALAPDILDSREAGSFNRRPFATETPANSDRGALVGYKDVAKLLNVSHRHVVRMAESGEMPPPIRLGRRVRWSLQVIEKWIADGCPHVGRG
jgi:excisionase family DNA binding protein